MNDLGHGQVWWVDLDKIRPVVVLTRSTVAPRLRRVLVAPVTSVARGLPTEVTLGPDEGVREGSVASLDNTQLVSVDRLIHRAGRIDRSRWREFCTAMSKVMAC